jgi:Uma2 family endonuclease
MNMPASPVLEPDDLLRMADGDRYELIDGFPVEKDMGAKADEIALAIGSQLRPYCLGKGLGRVYGPQTGYQCFPTRPALVRMPDVSFVPKGRLPDEESPDGHIKAAPALAVEVVSPNDKYEEIESKVADYRSAGVKLIWVVSPKSKTVVVRRLDGTCAEVNEGGELSGEDVVPGFACKVADLFV